MRTCETCDGDITDLHWNSKHCNEHKETARERARRSYQLNKAKNREKCAHRRATILQRTPSWANRDAIRGVYEEAGAGEEVDHIIPLVGENVSGLHVASNLRVIPTATNRVKGNRH